MILLMAVFSLIDTFDQEPNSWNDLLDYPVTVFALFGVFSYCYGISVVSKQVWRIFLPVLVIWDIYLITNMIIEDPTIFTDDYGYGFWAFVGLILSLVLFPCYIAIYLLQRGANNGN